LDKTQRYLTKHESGIHGEDNVLQVAYPYFTDVTNKLFLYTAESLTSTKPAIILKMISLFSSSYSQILSAADSRAVHCWNPESFLKWQGLAEIPADTKQHLSLEKHLLLSRRRKHLGEAVLPVPFVYEACFLSLYILNSFCSHSAF